ncbi:MAG: hypothetical protein FJ144_22105 [Deltaproteobacteria bacterium]|nr:hypothetical protein [Deltaproteobacteria bacterium]
MIALERPVGETGAVTPVPLASAAGDGGLLASLPRAGANGEKAESSNEVSLQLDPHASGSAVLSFPAALDDVGELVVRVGPGASPEQLHFLVTHAPTPLPPRVIRALRTPPQERTREQNGVLNLNFRADSPLLADLRARVQASRAAIADFQRIGPSPRERGPS